MKLALPKEAVDLTKEVLDAIHDANSKRVNPFVEVTAADRLFESFTLLDRFLRGLGFQPTATELWVQLIRTTVDWESNHPTKIHKGTPFFFLALNLIFQGDIDGAFLLIYNALEQDKTWSIALNKPDR